MELFHFGTNHALEVLATFAVAGGLLFDAFVHRHGVKAQRVANLLTITAHHREIWTLLLSTPSLARVFNSEVDLEEAPVTVEERLFITFLIFHLHNSFQAENSRMFRPTAGLASDIAGFFRLPIPQKIWDEAKSFQDPDFVSFVEIARASF